MNVAFDPWIPVLTQNGKTTEVSLCDVFEKGSAYADLSVFPHERVALMRLFAAVAHAALNGPKDKEEWNTAPQKLPTAARTYLEKWKDSFELHHPQKPWLQFADLKDKNGQNDNKSTWTPINKLAFHLASGNTSTLFDHGGTFGQKEIIRSLLSYQCFSPGGLMGQLLLGNTETKKSTRDAPCCPSSMLHALIRGKTLIESIVKNLPTHDLIETLYEKRLGRPVWEEMPLSLADEKRIENATQTYLGRLVPIKRFMLLSEDMKLFLLGDGPDYPGFFDGFPAEPTATVIVSKDKRKLLSYRTSRAIWRELGALIVRRNAASGIGGPLCLSLCGMDSSFDLTVDALARDQASIVDVVESVFHISPSIQTERGSEIYTAEVAYAEKVFGRLSWATETYRQEIDAGWGGRLKLAGPKKNNLRAKLTASAANHFWTTVETNLSLLFEMIDKLGTDAFPEAQKAWRAMLHETARTAYTTACSQETPRQMKAFAAGWKQLNSPIKSQPDGNDDQNDDTEEGDES